MLKKSILIIFILIGALLFNVPVAHATPTFDNQGWDFGKGTPVYGGYIDADNALYSSAVGYGWNASVTNLDRDNGGGGPFDALFEDFEYSGAPREFQINVTQNGDYNVTVWAGDIGWCLDTMVYMEDDYKFVLEGDGTVGGLWLYDSVVVTVSDGILNIGFKDKGTYGDGNFRANGILIEYLPPPPPLTSTTVYHTTTITSTTTGSSTTTMSEYLVNGTTIMSTSTVSNTSSTTTLYSTTTTIMDGTTVVSVDQTITIDELESEYVDHSVGLEGGGVTTILTLVGILAVALVIGYIVMKRRRR